MHDNELKRAVTFIKSWLAYRYEQTEIPGFTVAISQNNHILMNESYGYANLEQKIKLSPEHMFRIASHSKTFTATAIMQLKEQGKLRLDDYVSEYLPWLEGHKDQRWNSVTIRQLLSHSAGVIRDGHNADYWQLDRPFPDVVQLKKEILEAKLILDNNTVLKYSNIGFSLLGMLIEAITGQTYNQFVTEHIIAELDLKNTGPDYDSSIKEKAVTGYSRRDTNKSRLPIVQIDTKAMSAATGFYSTSGDMIEYFNAQFVGSHKLLSDDSKKEMQRIQWHSDKQHGHRNYGLGFEITTENDLLSFGHGGGFPGQRTRSIANSKQRLVVIVLTNCIDGPAAEIAKGIHKILNYYSVHAPKEEIDQELLSLEGRYVSLWNVIDLIVTGNQIIAANPDSWDPLDKAEELETLDQNNLKIKTADSFSSPGELVHFDVVNEKVLTLNYAGATMLPEQEWNEWQKNLSVIGS
jgi:D-alanyl-D-alanine carboxypeptidase